MALPRSGASWKLSDRLSFDLSYGLYAQRVPAFVVSQSPTFRDLPLMRAAHAVAGIRYSISQHVRLHVEYYDKQYRNLPTSPRDPHTNVIDDGFTLETYRSYPALVSSGVADSRGLEVLMQKKTGGQYSGLIAGSVSRSRYRDNQGIWRSRRFDNRYTFTFVGSYHPSRTWELSCRWNLAGGLPYSPFDTILSDLSGIGIADRKRIMAERQPAYHALHLQVDRRFNFRSSCLVLSLSVINAYNRANVAYYYWDDNANSVRTFHQLRIIPLLGVEYEF